MLGRLSLAFAFILTAVAPPYATAAEIASASLEIRGIALEVDTIAVTTGIDIPTTIQTRFGGRINSEVTAVEGLVAVGDLTGPGLDDAIQLTTAPGHRFQIPGFAREGVYYLQNIRLMNGGVFVTPATPPVATITVANLLQTSVSVRQLTPDELRSRGIVVDPRNYQVVEYSFSFLIDGQIVRIPYPVIIDSRTHQVTPIATETPYSLPPIGTVQPPRWSPPAIIPFELPPDPAPEQNDPSSDAREQTVRRSRPGIPAAIVIPNSLAILHQFFGLLLTLSNGAPSGSTATLADIRATVKLPAALRGIRSNPAVSFGQPVPIVDAANGVTFLVAQAKGDAGWTLEGLQPGTHTIEIDLRAKLRETGQEDVPLRATPRASIVVHDPRFNVTFSHPDTVRKGTDYSTYTFVTNTSAVPQTIQLANSLAGCDQAPGANVCRLSGQITDEITLAAGEMRMIEYKLRSGVTGSVFATAGTVGESITAAVQLHMGVSESGVPLSPATLLLPHYTRYAPPTLVDAYLQLLGLGYSIATAPVTQTTAKFPRVIRTDVFFRAVDLGRAGQRTFIANNSVEARRDAAANLALDLLGNAVELSEWDELRRREKSGRSAGAALMEEVVASAAAGRATIAELVDGFASATAHRAGYAFVAVYGAPSPANPRPYALAFRDASTRRCDVPNEADSGWIRDVPFADLSRFRETLGRTGEIGILGRWSDGVDVLINPAVSGPAAVEVILPAAAGGFLRAHFDLNLTQGEIVRIPLTRGATTLNAYSPNGGIASSAGTTAVQLPQLRIAGARQDLYLDPEGHKVAMLFNRPVAVPPPGDLRARVSARINFNTDGVTYTGVREIFAAALQEDGQVAVLSFDHVLTTNAAYQITVEPLADPATGGTANFAAPAIPLIDNTRDAAILYGRFLRADNTPIGAAEVRLFSGHFRGCETGLFSDDPPVDCNPYREAPQYARTEPDGTYLFEYIPRDPIGDPQLAGGYRLLGVSAAGRYTIVDGAVRLPRRVHFVNLQLLGRGAAEGVVRYDNGERVGGARVYVGSTMFSIGRTTTADANGAFRADDLPVGPLTFSATDAAGNVAYASGEIATPGQIATRDVVIHRRPFPGTGTVFGIVKRSDDGRPVAGARIGVFSQGYGLMETFTGTDGTFDFRKVPAGFITVLAAEWSIATKSVSVDFDLRADETHEVPPMILTIRGVQAGTSVTGDVLRENPLFPGDASKYERVGGAVIRLSGRPAVTADGSGRFVLDGVPLAFNGTSAAIQAYDPATKRVGSAPLPTLTEAGPNNVTIFLPAKSFGSGLIRVRLVNAIGLPVDGFRVIEPGFPPKRLLESGPGLYEYRDAPVGSSVTIFAVGGPAGYGDQFALGTARAEFPGHVVTMNLRLPGQGIVRAKLRSDIDLIGDVALTYAAWDEAEQGTSMKTVTASTSVNGVAEGATFQQVPALQSYQVTSAHPVFGHAQQSGSLSFEGDLANHVLQLNRLSTIAGAVYAIDGVTPIPGAAVRLEDGVRDAGIVTTLPDGTFTFHDVPAAADFRLIAAATTSGIYRTGVAYGKTPPNGGPIANIALVLKRRGSVEGRVVQSDSTPNDLSNNPPVPLAKFWLRELDFPSRGFGSDSEPLSADAAGRFAIGTVFVGPLRARAWDAENQELQGTWTGAIEQEGEVRADVVIVIGGDGTGEIEVTVADPNQQFLPVPNAEVQLHRGGLFDLTTTDAAGVARFHEVPVATYSVSAYSKARGKSGALATVVVERDTTARPRVLLDFSGKVDGTLTDPQSQPAGLGVPGAPVTLSATAYQSRASTTSAGAFSFEGIREGTFTLDAKDVGTNRRATGRRTLSAADPHPVVDLQLERTEALHVAVYLPDDTGGNSGVLAGPVTLDVVQRCGGGVCDFLRSAQGNPVTTQGLFAGAGYSLSATEIGGESRIMTFAGQFPKGTAADPVKLVYAAFGSVDVVVTQNGAPASGARVSINASGRTVTAFTDASGRASGQRIPLGNVSVQVTSIDGTFTGSANGTLTRQSVPLNLSVDLGAFAGISGLVEAELGGPSAGTRVVATFAGRTLEIATDADGRYTFQGIPTQAGGTPVSVVLIGPDGVTIGGRLSVILMNDSASKIVGMPLVRLDATPPQLLGIVPADGAVSVSPDTMVRLTFSEPIRADQITNAFLQLVPADGTGQVMALFDPPVVQSDGTFVVTIRPPPAVAPERFPLRSNTLYRLIVSGAIQDRTGHPLPAPRGTTFTTSDYAEPRVVRTVPAVTTPVPEQITFQFVFNEPVDPSPWQPGGSGVFRLYKLSSAGPGGVIAGEKAGRAHIDPATSAILFFAPDQPVEPDAFYRAVFSGIRDLQGNVLVEQTFHFFTFDRTRPFVRLVSPVPDGFALVSGVEYLLGADVRNGSAEAEPATDTATVEYFRVDGSNETFLASVGAAPFAYRFVAPEVVAGGSTLTLRARATDLSGNVSDPVSMVWEVRPNAPPANVAVALTPDVAFPGNSVLAAVTFQDEGLVATVQVIVRATRLSGAAYSESKTKQLTRTSVASSWPACELTFVLPPDLRPESGAIFEATVTDVRGLSLMASAPLTLRADAVAPAFVSVAPAAETQYRLNDQYRVDAVVVDAETEVAEVLFRVDGQEYRVPLASSQTGPVARSRRFLSPPITVPARNADRRVAIAVTATDFHGNASQRLLEVIYLGVNDPAAPKAAWLCPVDRAAVPAGRTGFPLSLRVRATDDVSVTAVQFRIAGVATPLVANRVGATDDFLAATIIDTPPGGESLAIVASISDADPAHTIEIPLSIASVAIDYAVNATLAITSDNVETYRNKSLVVESAAGRLVTHVPIALANLLVLDGGTVESPGTTTAREHKVDVSVTGHLFVDCASAVDVTAKGYLGGWGVNPDGSGTRNEGDRGRTVGNTTTGGALHASASHGGLGGLAAGGDANAAYGSIPEPAALGSGGGGTASVPGGTGGGAVTLSSAEGLIVIAGSVRADGAGGAGTFRAGSGGSVGLTARQIIIGPLARITANGGDATPAGGGGRVAIRASDRLDLPCGSMEDRHSCLSCLSCLLVQEGQAGVPVLHLEARGGRGPADLEPGAGTIFVRRPSQINGELHVASYGPSEPAPHWTRSTPISSGTGTSRFDFVEIGPFALARFDETVVVGAIADDRTSMTIHPTAAVVLQGDRPVASVVPTPAAGASLIRATTVDLSLNASSAAGISEVRVDLSGVPPVIESITGNPMTVTARRTLLPVPPETPLGDATVTVTVADRAGRVATLAPMPFTIVANQPPVIDLLTAPAGVYPGSTIPAVVDATDDVSVTRLTQTSQIGTEPAQVQVRTPAARTARESFNVTVPIATPGGSTVSIVASAEDAYPGRVPTTRPVVVNVLRDALPPLVSISQPAGGQIVDEGAGATFTVRASAIDQQVGVRSIAARTTDGAPIAMTGDSVAGWIAQVPVPIVDGTELVPVNVTVTAIDYEGNAGLASVAIRVRPLIDPNGPAIRWACSASAGSMYPPGYAAKLRVFAKGATTANGVQKVEITVNGSATVLTATPVSGLADHYEAILNVPNLADGSAVDFRATATSVAGNQADVAGRTTVVTSTLAPITTDTVINAANAATYANQTVIVQAGTVTLSAAHTFDRLLILHGARVTHPAGGAARVDVIATRGVFVACDSAIDVSGMGFVAGQTYVGGTIPGLRSGGSHLGLGARNTLPLGTTFGSVVNPSEPGGGADGTANGTAGGGVIRLSAMAVTNEGAIRANGADRAASTDSRTGAGGSVSIAATSIYGEGIVEAAGGLSFDGAAGGGGAVAIQYANGVIWSLRARTGLSGNSRFGGAGTIHLRGPSAVFGDLVVDNEGKGGEGTELPALGRGIAVIGSAGATLVTDRGADIPPYFAGHPVLVATSAGAAKGIWRIAAVSGRTATLAANGSDVPAVEVGDLWTGIYRFDNLKLRSSKLLTADRLLVTNLPDLDATSLILGNNLGAPLLNAALVSVRTAPTGAVAHGQVGAVSDPDRPVTVIATNQRTGASWSSLAALDGSFAVGVNGNAGDHILVRARDANVYPLESASLDAGQLVENVAVATQRDKTAWTTDAQFKPQTIALDGSLLVVASSYVNAGSDKLVVLDTANPAEPAHVRTIPTLAGPINDFESRDGWAFLATDRFSTVDVKTSAPVIKFTSDPCGREISVAVAGSYAFTGEADCANTGRIHVYDVSTPSVPRFLAVHDTPGLSGHAYTDLVPLGTSHLVGISDSVSGRDLVVIDRRDVNLLRKVSELAIPSFAAWRGEVRGTRLYLASRVTPELVIVELADPGAPVVVARIPLGAPAGHVAALEHFAFAAATTSGIVAVAVAPPAVAGAASTGGVAMDVAVGSGYAYVANETGIAILPLTLPPLIDERRIRILPAGTLASIAGTAGAITGQAPLQVEVTNVANAAAMTVAVAMDGSFAVSLPASAGDSIAIRAIDSFGRTAGPAAIGSVPFGTATRLVPITIVGQPGFRARAVKVDGNVAVVGSYTAYGTSSDRLVTLDISSPSLPVETRVIDTGGGPVLDFEVRNGWGYVAGDRFSTIDLRNPVSTPNLPADQCGRDSAVTISGGYAFTAEVDCSGVDGRIHVYDVSAPGAPRYLAVHSVGGVPGHAFSDLIAMGSDYLIAISASATGRDVMIVDRRDVNSLRKVAELVIPSISGFRGRLSGGTLYVAGQEGGVAMVDVSAPAAPRLMSVVDTPGLAFGIEASGNTVMVADRGAGVTFLDASAPAPRVTGVQPIPGDAWDVALGATHLYVANEIGLVVIENVAAPPRIAASLITIAPNGLTTGGPGAVTGQAPLQAEVRNTATGASITVTVALDGSFTTLVPSLPGENLTLRATDTFGRTAGPVAIGSIPFGTATRLVPITIVGQPGFRARAVKVDGNVAVVGSYTAYGTDSDRLVAFDISTPSVPVQTRVIETGGGPILDFEVRDGWGYVTGDRLSTIDLRNPVSTPNLAPDVCGRDSAVAISGGYAFTAEVGCAGDTGRIHVYDASTPNAVRYLATHAVAGTAGHTFSDLIAMGSDYLIAISASPTGRDVMIVDRRDVNLLRKVAELVIPGISGFRGRLAGGTLYVAGQEGGVAMVDVSAPTAPRLMSVVDTPGLAFGIEASGSTMIVADRGAGVTFLDAATAALRVTGVQPIVGDAWDVALGAGNLYVANEIGLVVVDNVAAPPAIDPSRITVASAGATAMVSGADRSVGGVAPVTIAVTNESTASSPQPVAATTAGSFTASIAGSPGHRMLVAATDAAGRRSSSSAGSVPFVRVVHEQPATLAGEPNLFGRRIGAYGNVVVVSGGTVYGQNIRSSTRALLFRQPNASDAPQILPVDAATDEIFDMDVRGSIAYFASDRVTAIDLSVAIPTRSLSTDTCGRDAAVLAIGTYVLTAQEGCGPGPTGAINIYDAAAPLTPAFLRTQPIASAGGVTYRDLLSFGSTHVIAVSPDANRDVTIIDIGNMQSLVRIAELDIPNFAAFAGAVDGTTLYLAGGDAGIAIVDLSNPAAPQHLITIDTPGIARGVAVSGPAEIVVADAGGPGLTFINTTARASPVLLGSQPLRGNATDVKVVGNRIYAATETRFYVLERP